ncbi:tetratricopeptide repeat protein [Gryllotalpicola protaetiae]|nr:hypothetical protein [Gryllotalpicola protaetiae]
MDTLLGKLLELVGRLLRKLSFTWRVAHQVQVTAAEDGYAVSATALRAVLRERAVRAAVKRRKPGDIVRAKHRLATVRAIHADGSRLSSDKLFELSRTAYLGASEQAERDLGIRDEMTSGFAALTLDGGAREPLWQANLARISPPLAADLSVLRRVLGDPVDKLLHLLVNSPNRSEQLSAWTAARPEWLPFEGSLLGWLGELSVEIGAAAAARHWFQAAVSAGAAPTEYWRARLLLVESSKTDQEKLASVADIVTHPLLAALTTGRLEDRIEYLREWDTRSQMQASLRAALIVDCLADLRNFDEAIHYGTTAYREESFGGAGINAVEAYIRRSGYHHGSHAPDLTSALSLALEIRNARRRWGLTAGTAVAKAVKAAVMLADIELAFSLARPPEATPEEAMHPDVRREAIVAMGLLGNVPGAKDLVDESTPEWIRLQVASFEAEALNDQDGANELLARAIDAVDDWSQKAQLAFRLASRGVVHPFIDELRADNPETAEELEIAAGLYAGTPGAEARAKARAIERPTIAFSLITFFEKSGRRRDVIFVAEQAAAAWVDPELWLKAAHTHLLERESRLAIDRATKALDAGGASWGNRAGAYRVQVEAASSIGDWTTALASAQMLLRLDPSSTSAQWAVVRIRRNSGDVDQAYLDWKVGKPGPRPRIPDEAMTWLEMFRLHGSEMATLREFFEVANGFAENSDVRNMALGALLSAPITEPVEELNFNALLQRFERDYPGQSPVRALTIEEGADATAIIAALDEAVGTREKTLKPLDEGITKGTLPIGFAARPAGKHVAELLNIRHKSPRYAGSLRPDDEFQAIALALSLGAVVDVTALFTLALLREANADLLIAKLPELTTASEQMLDAVAAREAFNRAPGGTFFSSTADRAATFALADPIEHDQQRRTAVRLVSLFLRSSRQSGWPYVTSFAEHIGGGADGIWLASLDLAVKTDRPLWCDDAATRAVAREMGADTFGTPALVEYLRRDGTIPSGEANQLDAELIHNWTIGVAYRNAVIDEVSQIDQMAPEGLAAWILHGGPDNALEKVDFVVHAMGAVVALPDQLAGWTAIAFKYLADVAGSPSAVLDNHTNLLHRLLLQPWLGPSSLVFVVDAGHREAGALWGEAFERGFRLMFSQIAQQIGHESAANYALGLVAQLEPRDRQLALAVILSP